MSIACIERRGCLSPDAQGRGSAPAPRSLGPLGHLASGARRFACIQCDLVPEMALARKHHGHSRRVGDRHHLFVAHGPPARSPLRCRLPPPPRRRRRTGRTRPTPARSLAPAHPPARPRYATLLTRFGCPAPMPSNVRSFTSTIAFDLTCLQIRQANARSASSCLRRLALARDLELQRLVRLAVRLLQQVATGDAAQVVWACRRPAAPRECGSCGIGSTTSSPLR